MELDTKMDAYVKEEDTREKILNASREVFSKNGYSRSSTKEISRVAQVAEITLYRHFETKNNLFIETILKYIVKPILNVKSINSKVNSEQVIKGIIEERADTLRKNKDLFICTIYEAQVNNEIRDMLRGIFSKVFDDMLPYIDVKLSDENIELKAQIILSTIVGSIIFEALTGSEIFKDSNNYYEVIKIFV